MKNSTHTTQNKREPLKQKIEWDESHLANSKSLLLKRKVKRLLRDTKFQILTLLQVLISL